MVYRNAPEHAGWMHELLGRIVPRQVDVIRSHQRPALLFSSRGKMPDTFQSVCRVKPWGSKRGLSLPFYLLQATLKGLDLWVALWTCRLGVLIRTARDQLR